MAKDKQLKAAAIAAKKKGGKGGKPPSKKSILIEAGFSENTAKTPSKVFNTKSFKDLLDEYIPEDKILKTVGDLLDAKIITKEYTNGNVVYVEEREDTNARSKGADMAIKVRGLYAAQKVTIVDPLDAMSDDELDEQIAQAEALIKKRLKQKPKEKGKIKDGK